MGGFFGAVSTQDVSLDIFFGVDYHSHLGTRRGGMIIHDARDGFQRQIHSIENTPFRTKFEKDLAKPWASSTTPRSWWTSTFPTTATSLWP